MKTPYSFVRFQICPTCGKNMDEFYVAPPDLYPWEKDRAEKILLEKLETHIIMDHGDFDTPAIPKRFSA